MPHEWKKIHRQGNRFQFSICENCGTERRWNMGHLSSKYRAFATDIWQPERPECNGAWKQEREDFYESVNPHNTF